MTNPLDTIVEEAKKSFDLTDRLKGRKAREGQITLYMEDAKDGKDSAFHGVPESKLVFHLRAVPELIVKDIRRKARKAYIVKGSGNIPEDKMPEFLSTYSALLLAAITVNVDNADGEESGPLSEALAADIENYLPAYEYKRLDAKVAEIQFQQSVADGVTANADF